MTVSEARRLLHIHGRNTPEHREKVNWRLKGLLLAALPDSGVRSEDIAKAWPSANSSEYRFLAHSSGHDMEQEKNRTVVAESGTEQHRLLKDFALNAGDVTDLPKRLSGSTSHISEEGGRVEARLDYAIPRMLFAASSPEEIDTLFREQLLETVMAGAERRKVARDASNVINAATRKGDVPVGDDEGTAHPTAQGAEIRDDRKDYTTVSWSTTKYSKGARVTDEMQEQAMIDVIEDQIERMGASVENAINRVWLTELVDNSANNHDTAGSNQGYAALNSAYTEVDKNDFVPTAYVTHPEYRGVLFDDTNLAYANRAGTADVLQNREEASLVDNLAGLDTHAGASSSTYDDGTDTGWSGGNETWGFANDGEIGAVVYDPGHMHVIMYSAGGNDITIKDYEDPIRDLQGVNARVEADAKFSQARSAATVEY